MRTRSTTYPAKGRAIRGANCGVIDNVPIIETKVVIMKYFLAGAISIAIIFLAYFLHKVLLNKLLQNSEKIQDIDAGESKLREDIALGKARTVYFVIWLILCLLCVILEICFGGEVRETSNYFAFSVLILLGGFGGIITKFGGLKLPINVNSIIYFYFINPLLIVIAVFTMFHYI